MKRLEGQLKKLRQRIEEEADCHEVIPQFLAVKGALAAVYEEYLKVSLRQCRSKDVAQMEDLITMLIRS